MPPIFVYYMYVVIGDHPEAIPAWHVATFEFILLVSIRYLFVAEPDKVGYDALTSVLFMARAAGFPPFERASDIVLTIMALLS